MKTQVKAKDYGKSDKNPKRAVRENNVVHHYNSSGNHLSSETFATNSAARERMEELK